MPAVRATQEFRQIDQKPVWRQALNDLVKFASGLCSESRTQEGATRPTMAMVASEVMKQLGCAEPEITPHAAIVLINEDASTDGLMVRAATPAATQQSARAKVGALWHSSTKQALAADAFKVFKTDEPILRSEFGTDATAR